MNADEHFDRVTQHAQLLPDIDDIDDPDDIDSGLLVMVATEMNAAVRLALSALRQS